MANFNNQESAFTPFWGGRSWNLQNTCSKRAPVINPSPRRVFFFPLDSWSYIFLWIFELQGIRNLPGVKKQSKKHLSWTRRQGLTQHMRKNSGSISRKRCRHYLGFCAENMHNLRSGLVITWFQHGINFRHYRWLVIGLTHSQIEYWAKNYRHALGCLEPARSKNKREKRIALTETPGHYWPFGSPEVGGDKFSPLDPVRGPEQKKWLCHPLPLFMASVWY